MVPVCLSVAIHGNNYFFSLFTQKNFQQNTSEKSQVSNKQQNKDVSTCSSQS
jgi:hypothetical protein